MHRLLGLRKMHVSEEVVSFGEATSLVGILTCPSESQSTVRSPAVILVNVGIMHRVGPNRLYVKVARRLARLGFPVLRFDLSGLGDSPARKDHVPAPQSRVGETQEAMSQVSMSTGVQDFVLTGICSGANLSYEVACCDDRVVGAALINPRYHLHDPGGKIDSYLRHRAFIRHYLRMAFFSSFSAKIWSSIVTGQLRRQSATRALRGFAPSGLLCRSRVTAAAANQAEAELRALARRGVRILHIYSEGDEGLDYFRTVLGVRTGGLEAGGLLDIEVIPGINHTFALLASQEHVLNSVSRWVRKAQWD